MNRKDIKAKHEQYVVNEFLRFWENQNREIFRVVERPDPPDAIVESAQRRTWIEVASVYASDDWAHDLHSYANPDEDHKPMPPGPYTDVDRMFAKRFIDVLRQKLAKQSYAAMDKALGPGILVLDMKSPWFGDDTWEIILQEPQRQDWSICTGYFSMVFITYRIMSNNLFKELRVCPTNHSSATREPSGSLAAQ